MNSDTKIESAKKAAQDLISGVEYLVGITKLPGVKSTTEIERVIKETISNIVNSTAFQITQKTLKESGLYDKGTNNLLEGMKRILDYYS